MYILYFIFLIVVLAIAICYFAFHPDNKPADVKTVDLEPTNQPKIEPVKKSISKNEQRNFHKSAIKARRQGHLSFMYHGNYYATGLNKLDGTGK